MTDLRRHPRRRTLLSGKLVFDGGARSFDCVIRDMSASGARVQLPGPEILPRTLWLIEMRAGLAHQCRVSWRQGRETGLQFEHSYRLTEVGEGELAMLRQLWLQGRPR